MKRKTPTLKCLQKCHIITGSFEYCRRHHVNSTLVKLVNGIPFGMTVCELKNCFQFFNCVLYFFSRVPDRDDLFQLLFRKNLHRKQIPTRCIQSDLTEVNHVQTIEMSRTTTIMIIYNSEIENNVARASSHQVSMKSIRIFSYFFFIIIIFLLHSLWTLNPFFFKVTEQFTGLPLA